MKTTNKFFFAALLIAAVSMTARAQQVNTLYFLENAPMRHILNPAFQPVSQGYVNFSPLGWTMGNLGNNSLVLSDVVYVDPATGKTVTALYPGQNRQLMLNALRNMTDVNGSLTAGIVNVGVRIKDAGFLTVGLNVRVDADVTMPKQLFNSIAMGGLAVNPNNVAYNLTGLGAGSTVFTEISGGYSHRINDQWTVGGKLKFLLGHFNYGMNSNQLSLEGTPDAMRLQGVLNADLAGQINFQKLPNTTNTTIGQFIDDWNAGNYKIDDFINTKDIPGLLVPAGYGLAFDLGATYKPAEWVQISAAITDLGFIYWNNSRRLGLVLDTIIDGVGNINYGDYQDASGNFSTNMLMDSVKSKVVNILRGAKLQSATAGYAKMPTAKLNVGVDFNFWDNRVGLGILSATRLYNARLYEELTLGAAFRPVNWFNIAVSYSLLQNGKYSNIGAGLSFMPYDGVNMTLAFDYIPTSYANIPNAQNKPLYYIPDRAKTVNVALGFSIVWGTNHKDSDKDGIWDKIDMCPETPRGVEVDSVGCPLDEDHDGVPDYLDHCLGTPAAAIGYVDSLGCMLDTDGDGVEDYRDECPNTPEAAWGQVDSVGCPLDTDGDAVPDYIDECPGTPAEAWGKVDAKGCPLDSDGDGVPDYLDECPGTPAEAYGQIDAKGCPVDSDNDGVPDYKDECPGTPKEAIGHVDAKGCNLDSDNDGVPDYIDECPMVPGLKENKGCPEVKREVRNLLKKAMQGIEFETGKANIKKKSYPLLNQIAKIFIENKDYIVEVQGHTDNTGSYEINKELSDKRANAVRDYLIAQGVDFQRLSAVGYGPDVPIADNKTKSGRAKNRRVEFKITFEEISYESVMDHADPAPAPAAAPADSTAVAK